MNASQRRHIRRALSASTGFVPGVKVCRMTDNGPGAVVGIVQAVAPGGNRDLMVKLKNGRAVRWPVASSLAVPA